MTTVGRVVGPLLALALGVLSPVQACGLEASYNGKLRVSYPGAIEVAVAVANAWRNGLLPAADARVLSGEERLEIMLTDLRRLHARLAVRLGLVAFSGRDTAAVRSTPSRGAAVADLKVGSHSVYHRIC